MDPDDLERENMYAPPAVPDAPDERDHQRGEPWTIGSCVAAAARASVRAPVFAWLGLGVIPNIPMFLNEQVAFDSTATLGMQVLSLALSAVLTGGQLRIALALIRDEPTSFMVFPSYARLAPGFFLLSLPALLPALLGFAIQDPTSGVPLLGVGILPISLSVVYVAFRLSLATYAWADSPGRLGRAVSYSWWRTKANVGKFVLLFLVTGLPNLVSIGLATLAPVAGTLFSIATLPLVTLSWIHAYDAGLSSDDPNE